MVLDFSQAWGCVVGLWGLEFRSPFRLQVSGFRLGSFNYAALVAL